MRKRRTRGHVIADLSVNHVERQVLLAGNTLERFVSDYGLDLQIWTFGETGEVEEGFVLVQVKATDSVQFVENGEFASVRVERRDYRFWARQPSPVILVLYDASKDTAYWVHVQEHSRSLSRMQPSNITEFSATLTVRIPVSQRLTVAAINAIAELKEWPR